MRPLLVLLALGMAVLSGCSKNSDTEEMGQQIGDVMASIDEAGGSGGTLAMLPRIEDSSRTMKRLAPTELKAPWWDVLTANAYATSCGAASTFGSCTSNVLTRTFGNCSIGSATLSGTVTLTWGGSSSSCTLGSATDTITRVPDFTLTGRRGATLTVRKSGTIGQRLTWSSGSGTSKVFSFSNDGIQRTFTTSSGETTFDFTTITTSSITITGTTRASRVVNGGTLRVTNNLKGLYCDFSPTSVTWASTCNCPVSGSWSGTCSDGTTSSLTLSGCGTGTIKVGSSEEDVDFDRCYSI